MDRMNVRRECWSYSSKGLFSLTAKDYICVFESSLEKKTPTILEYD